MMGTGNLLGTMLSGTIMLGGWFSWIDDAINAFMTYVIYAPMYYLVTGICWLVKLLYSIFEVFAGLKMVRVGQTHDYLLNVFFSNTAVSKVYWGMAMISIILCFVFAMISVGKKSFDLEQKQQHSMGAILGNVFKSILMIISFTAIMTMVMNATNLLLQTVNDLMVNNQSTSESQSIVYTDAQYARMARVLNTIGNYSLSPSYDNRVNINRCFNACRADLKALQDEKVFNFPYTLDETSKKSWQGVLQQIANSASLDEDLKLDVYNESVTKAIEAAVTSLRTDASFAPLKSYVHPYTRTDSVSMDVILFLSSTMNAANNPAANVSPSMTDAVRGPYFTGEKDIYSLDQVKSDFNISFSTFSYIQLILFGCVAAYCLFKIIIACAVRIFNMVLLYVIAPVTFSTMPLDDGGKYKQWLTAFIVQCVGIFGTVISMQLLLIFIGVIYDSNLVLFDSGILNFFSKALLIIAGLFAVEKANGIITGILSDNAGYQSVMASGASGEMSAKLGAYAMGGAATAKGLGFGAAKMAGGAIGSAIKPYTRAGMRERAQEAMKMQASLPPMANGMQNFGVGDYFVGSTYSGGGDAKYGSARGTSGGSGGSSGSSLPGNNASVGLGGSGGSSGSSGAGSGSLPGSNASVGLGGSGGSSGSSGAGSGSLPGSSASVGRGGSGGSSGSSGAGSGSLPGSRASSGSSGASAGSAGPNGRPRSSSVGGGSLPSGSGNQSSGSGAGQRPRSASVNPSTQPPLRRPPKIE